MKTLQIGCIAMVLSIPGFTSGGVSLPAQVEGHRSGIMASVVSANGSSRTVTLEGLGCSESMCSRVFIRTQSESGTAVRNWIDSIASIKDATERNALFVMKDGTERRLTFVPDFRVLYVSTPNGKSEKLDLGKIQSLQFLASK